MNDGDGSTPGSGIQMWLLMLLWMLPVPGGLLAAEELLSTGTSWDGGAIAYPGGDPLVSSYRVLLDRDQETPMHCHPVPTLGYLVRGTLEIETRVGDVLTLEAGESLVEVMNTVHRGRAVGGPVEIIVFYAGAAGVPNTILAEGGAGSEPCLTD